MEFKIKKKHKTFGGETIFAEHFSEITKTNMNFSYFLPSGGKVERAIVWLSGLTCTEENFITKAGAQKYLSETKTMVICPDTSPRGLELPNEHEAYDFGSGAGFYLNATTAGYGDHYRMEDYLVNELVPFVRTKFEIEHFSISGHSMGGHGALTLGLNYPEIFEKISAFSPIVNPTQVPWGEKAFNGYLGSDRESWKKYDACEILKSGKKHPQEILIDQGTGDEFLEEQLKTEHFENAASNASQSVNVRYQEGYDHSYYFISSFIEDHIRHLIS